MLSAQCRAADEMERFAARFRPAAADGLNIYLQGPLGAGKTTFARGLLRALGHAGAVKSPTYTLVEPYHLASCDVYHFDCYRFHEPTELESIGYRDYFAAAGCCLVEWPERAGDLLPPPDIKVELRIRAPGRHLRCQAHSERGRAALAAIAERNPTKNSKIP